MAGAFNWNGPTPMGLASYVQGQGEYGRQRGEDSRLARLVSGAMADPSKRQANVAEIASFRPEAAFQAQGQFDQQQDRKYAELGKRAAVLVGAPQAMQGQVWAQLRPELEQMGLAGLSEQVTPEILQTAQQLARVYGGLNDGSQEPSSVREARAFQADPSLLATRKAMYDTYSWGETKDEQGRDVWVPRSNRTAAIGGPQGSGAVSVGEPVQVAGGASNGGIPQTPLLNTFSQQFPGFRATSTYRDPKHNADVGGVSNSYHTRDGGAAIDGYPSSPQELAQIEQWAAQNGHEVIKYPGGRIHVEPAPGGAGGMVQTSGGYAGAPAPSAPQAAPAGGYGQTDADRANAAAMKVRAEETARRQLGLEYAGPEADAAAAKEAKVTDARETAQSAAERRALLPQVITKADQTVALIDKALNHPGLATATGMSGSLDPRNYVPGTDATDFRVLLDQLKGQTFLEAFQSLKGGGAITQVEGQKAEQAIARLNTAQSDAEFKKALEELADVAASAKKRAIEMAGSEQAPPPPAIQPGAVEDGWRFKGGNPADQANWVRI